MPNTYVIIIYKTLLFIDITELCVGWLFYQTNQMWRKEKREPISPNYSRETIACF